MHDKPIKTAKSEDDSSKLLECIISVPAGTFALNSYLRRCGLDATAVVNVQRKDDCYHMFYRTQRDSVKNSPWCEFRSILFGIIVGALLRQLFI